MTTPSLTIPARFNGPPNSGNGGYSCGALAGYIDGPARVRLHVPPPLDRELAVVSTEDGKLELRDGDILVGSASSCELDMEIPEPPTLEQATKASEGFLCFHEHVFDTCFVCGPGRPAHDGLELFPGPVDDWQLLACSWQPREDLLDDEGYIRPEILWSALDCPGYFAAMGENIRHAVLGELDANIISRVKGTQPLVVFAWPIEEDGRKLYAGTAIARTDGSLVAYSKSTWILLKQ